MSPPSSAELQRAATRPEPRVDGPLLAVCGLCGGAGASTLSYLVGCWFAERAAAPVLVAEAAGPTGGLAAYAGAESRSLPDVAEDLAAGAPVLERLFSELRSGLRVMAGRPRLDHDCDEPAAARLLRDARAAHALTVVDCGQLAHPAGRLALAAATHVAWVLPATVSGALRARRLLELLPASPAAELVIARHDPAGRRPPLAELGALAERRGAPLVLMPHVPDLAERPAGEALAAAALTLQAIDGVLGR